MKKLIILALIIMGLSLNTLEVKANSDYRSFQQIEFVENNYKLLDDFTKEDFKAYYKKTGKKKFDAWKTYEVTRKERVKYIDETVLSVYNDGYSDMVYDMSFTEEKIVKTSIDSTGSLDISLSGAVRKFKGGLDSKLKINRSKSETYTIRKGWSMKINVDPGTMLNVYTYGEGNISNGVAIYYFFWCTQKKGGYEIFTLTSQAYRMEKIKI